MAALTGFLVPLVCILLPACASQSCIGFGHLENGRTFFRYGGLFVIFRCRPGYRLHGYQTNSCVSGYWSRALPICVSSGCPSPGHLVHGVSSVNEDGSWVVFSCNGGFRLYGPSTLYCKGHTWNGSKPVCKEADMMSSVWNQDLQVPITPQKLQPSPVQEKQLPNAQYHTNANTASKQSALKSSGLSSRMPSHTSNRNGITANDQKVYSERQVQYRSPHAKAEVWSIEATSQRGTIAAVTESDRDEEPGQSSPPLDTETLWKYLEVKGHVEKAMAVDRGTRVSQMPLTPAVHVTTESPNSADGSSTSTSTSQRAQTSPATTITSSVLDHTEEVTSHRSRALTPTPSELLQFANQEGFTLSNASQDHVTNPDIGPSRSSATMDGNTQAVPKQSSTAMRPSQGGPLGPEGEEAGPSQTTQKLPPDVPSLEHQSTSVSFPSTPSSSSSTLTPSSSSTSSSPLTTPSISISSRHPNVMALPTVLTTPSQMPLYRHLSRNVTDSGAPLSRSLSRRPVCPYPPVPTHGTFSFRNVENPGPRQYRHYIQYSCYPGYTLARGDINSYCQHGGTWSAVTPVCLELTPCSVNNGGCSQLCSHSSNQSKTLTQCRCRPGFTLLDDRRTCRDVDECLLPVAVTGCMFGCVNTPGSFHCQCPAGYSLDSADRHCQDKDECAVNQGRGPCTERCHNSPGSYRCSCGHGRALAGDGRSCVVQCPAGFRRAPQTLEPGNVTTHTLRGDCVDVDECQEEDLELNGCQWQCVNLPGSHRCICPRGYTLQADGRHCKDINECSRKNGGCSHLCVNQKGAYKCVCPPSHRHSHYSWKKCVPREAPSPGASPTLVFPSVLSFGLN